MLLIVIILRFQKGWSLLQRHVKTMADAIIERKKMKKVDTMVDLLASLMLLILEFYSK